MSNNQVASECDEWSDWLLHLRHADDPAFNCVVHGVIEVYANHVLDEPNSLRG